MPILVGLIVLLITALIGSMFSQWLRTNLVNGLGWLYASVVNSALAVNERICRIIGTIVWFKVIMILLLVYGIKTQTYWLITFVLTFTALILLVFLVTIDPIVKSIGKKWQVTEEIIREFIKPLESLTLWLFFFSFLSAVKPDWFIGGMEKTVVLGTGLLFLSTLAIYLKTKGRIVPKVMTAMVLLMLFSYFFKLQAPNVYRASQRVGSAKEQQGAIILDRYAIKVETDAKITMARLTENAVLFERKQNSFILAETEPKELKENTKVAVLNLSDDKAPVLDGAEVMLEIIAPDSNNMYLSSAPRRWISARKIQLESALINKNQPTQSPVQQSQRAAPRRLHGIYRLPADGTVVDRDKEGYTMEILVGEKVRFTQLTTPTKFEAINENNINLKITDEIYTSGKNSKAGKIPLKTITGKEVVVEVQIIPADQ